MNEKLKAAYQYALKSPEGAEILADLRDRLGVDQPIGVAEHGEMCYRACGLDLWLYINEMLKEKNDE
jgi:hypothetical protein